MLRPSIFPIRRSKIHAVHRAGSSASPTPPRRLFQSATKLGAGTSIYAAGPQKTAPGNAIHEPHCYWVSAASRFSISYRRPSIEVLQQKLASTLTQASVSFHPSRWAPSHWTYPQWPLTGLANEDACNSVDRIWELKSALCEASGVNRMFNSVADLLLYTRGRKNCEFDVSSEWYR